MSMKKDDELDPRLASLLEDLKPVPARNPQAASRARSRFLAQAVSARGEARHNWWNIFPQKENFTMKLIVTSIILVGLLFGGGATVAAAQDALPTDALYQVKLVSEQAELTFTPDPAAKVELLMEQAQTRTNEMLKLAAMGIVPEETLTTRTRERIQQALQLTAGLDDIAMAATLDRIRTQLQDQEHKMEQLQDGTCTGCEPVLQQTRDMLRTQLHTAENGLADPQIFRNMYRHQTRTTQTPGVTGTPSPTDAATEVTPTPQSTCTPAQDGTGNQYRNGNGNPSPETTPVPKNDGNQNGDGNGNGNTPQPTPGGNGNGNGGTPQPPTPGGNGNGGTPPPTKGGQGGKP
jgi:hypothetical protein